MKQISSMLVAIVTGFCCAGQPTIKWGEAFKLRKGSTDLDVIYTDKSGVYLQEGHLALKSYFVIGATARESATLIKVDKNLAEIYRSDFNKELKGKEFVQLFTCQDKMFLFASEYSKREKTLAIFAAEVNKNSGELTETWKPVTSFQKEEKKDEIEFKLTYNADSTKIVIVSSVQGKERNEYQVQEFDKNIKPSSKPIVITNEFEPKKFQLEDVLYTINKRVIMVGRRYEYEEGKRKKEKFLDFTNYNIRIYNEQGKQQTEINTNVNGKWLNSTKLLQEKNKDLVLAAFYSNDKKSKTIDGLLVQRIDPVTGKVLATSDKPINNSLLAAAQNETANDDEEEDKEESRAERKERERLNKMKDEGEGFSRYMQFRNIFYTSDNGLIILAEQYHQYTTTSQSYTPGSNGMPGQWRTTTYSVYESGDLMMCKVDAAGNIGWLQVLPKAQREVIQGSSGYNTIVSYTSYFGTYNLPFYSGFGAIQTGNTIQLILNDNPKNAAVTQAGQKAKTTTRFGKSDCYVLSLDEATGKCARKFFFNNSDVPTAMPRLGAVIGEEMYVVGRTDRMLGKTKIAVARITIK